MVKRLQTWLTVLVFLGLFLLFFDAFIHREVFSQKYGFSATTLGVIFIIAEIFFNAGIVLMLKGLGVFKLKLKDILRFKLDKANFESNFFVAGFIVNRIAASIPWVYVLGVGWEKLPTAMIGLIVMELLIVVILTFGVLEVSSKYGYQKS